MDRVNLSDRRPQEIAQGEHAPKTIIAITIAVCLLRLAFASIFFGSFLPNSVTDLTKFPLAVSDALESCLKQEK